MSNLLFAIYWTFAAATIIGLPLSLVHFIVNNLQPAG